MIGFSRMMIGYLVIALYQVPTHTFPGCCNGLDSWDVGLRKQWRERIWALYVKMLGDKTHVMFHHPFLYPLSILFFYPFRYPFFYPFRYPFFYPFLYISVSIFYSIISHFQTHPFIADFIILMPISFRDFAADSLPESLNLPNSWLVISCYIPFISH